MSNLPFVIGEGSVVILIVEVDLVVVSVVVVVVVVFFVVIAPTVFGTVVTTADVVVVVSGCPSVCLVIRTNTIILKIHEYYKFNDNS